VLWVAAFSTLLVDIEVLVLAVALAWSRGPNLVATEAA